MKVTLLASTPNAEELICKAAHVCYSAKAIADIKTEDTGVMIERLIDAGHTSVLEHANFTFGIEGISRVCLAQLTRHRLASYSVRSQRYVEVKAGEYVGDDKEFMLERFKEYREKIESGMKKEDARYELPQGVTTTLILTMNARALLNFFSLRCCYKAQWEIRELANEILKQVKSIAPGIFKNAGAFCDQNGYCKEAYTCGRKNVPHRDFLFELYEFWKTEAAK